MDVPATGSHTLLIGQEQGQVEPNIAFCARIGYAESQEDKRLDSPYLIGKRSGDWLKIKVAHTADFEVI